MYIGGYQKLTLIDYPGKLATTVFTVGCNFRCHFCHNPELVSGIKYDVSNTEKDFFKFLKERQGMLEGVCITGGEPTVQSDILEFMEKVKKMGFLVKLDTNGTRPDIVKKVLDGKLADYIAMDIKNTPDNYPETVGGVPIDIERIKLSVELIKNSGLSYDFRTTVVPGIHKESDFIEIAKWLSGSRLYALQEFRETRVLNPEFFKGRKKEELDLEKIKKMIGKHFGDVHIRN